MTHPNKRKGNRYEREVVAVVRSYGLNAERAWGSDGRALGESAETDVLIQEGDVRLQCKRRKMLPLWLNPEGADVVVFREDCGRNYVLLPLDTFLGIICNDFE